MNELNVVNREVILEQVADKGLFLICIRRVHLFTESFVSVFYIIIRLGRKNVFVSSKCSFSDSNKYYQH